LSVYRKPTASWPGQLTDGVTAVVHEVSLTVDGDALVISAADGAAPGGIGGGPPPRWPLARLAVAAAGPGRVTVTCADAPGAALVTDAEAVAVNASLTAPDAVRKTLGRWRAILAYAAGAVVIAAVIYANLDGLARAIARRVPASYEAQLGGAVAAVLAREYCETDAARAALDRLVGRLRRPDDPPPQTPHIMDSQMINAFTLPGGVVVVTKGLIAQSEGPDELAGVLAHELEHVRRRHVMIHVVRDGMLAALWQATVGDYSGLLIVDPKTAVDIANLRFSRDDEREADQGALERLDAAAISRAGFRAFFERVRAKTDGVPAWLSNHPSSEERIRAIREDVGALHRTPALSDADWAALRAGCAKGPR
jgi:predicted Zn-dependent protease